MIENVEMVVSRWVQRAVPTFIIIERQKEQNFRIRVKAMTSEN